MNLTSFLEKVTLLFVIALYHVTIFAPVEAQRSVRVIKTKLTSPLHIHLPGGSNNAAYAKRYGYGRPGPNYNLQGKNKNYSERRNRKFGPRNYANDFKNWTPNRFPGGKYNTRADNGKYHPRADNGKRGPQRPRKEPYPFVRESPFKNSNPKRKFRPQNVGHLQRPQPPRLLKDFDDEYYFPEEAIKAESQYDHEASHSKPKKKRRNPSDVEKVLKRPDSKGQYYGAVKLGKPTRHRTQETDFGSFVKWPSTEDEDYEEVDAPEYIHQSAKSKKRKLKKKSHSKKKIKDSEYDLDDPLGAYDGDTTERSSKKRIKKQPYLVKDDEERKYGSGNTGLSAVNNFPNSFNSKPQDQPPLSPPYQQTWSQIVGTTQRTVPFNTFNNNLQSFQPQQFTPNQFSSPQQNFQNQIGYQNYVQKPQISSNQQHVAANNQPSNFFSQPDNFYPKNVVFGGSNNNVNPNNNNYNYNNHYASNQLSTERAQVSASYNAYSFQPSNYNPNNQNYHSQYNNNNNNQYNSNSNQYNPNNYVKNQSLSYLDNTQKYGNRGVTTSYQSGPSDVETDFLKRHQSLYNKGLTGVPIQGDGYRKDATKGDFDIGYGDFQFDENTTT